MTIKPFVDQQDLMEKARNAIAVPNRSLIFTELEYTLIVVSLLTLLVVPPYNRRDRGQPQKLGPCAESYVEKCPFRQILDFRR